MKNLKPLVLFLIPAAAYGISLNVPEKDIYWNCRMIYMIIYTILAVVLSFTFKN